MKERPILFSAPMVRAILEGRKTMTRRVVKYPEWKENHDSYTCKVATVYKYFDVSGHNWFTWDSEGVGGWNSKAGTIEQAKEHSYIAAIGQAFATCPYGQPGERLWVRETFLYDDFMHDKTAGVPDLPGGRFSHRLVYRASQPDYPITVGSEKWKPSIFMPRWASRITLEITNVRVERLQDISEEDAKAEGIPGFHPILDFCDLWITLNGKESWRANPWVWVVEFKRIAA